MTTENILLLFSFEEGSVPPIVDLRITEDGIPRVTENDDPRVTE